MVNSGKFYGRLIIEGVIESKTGLHIGTGRDVMQIGGVDNPVVRDPLTREPYIPGSSLKGKMRSLLEKQEFAIAANKVEEFFKKNLGKNIRHHECDSEVCKICRLFGASTGSGVSQNRPARLSISDAHMTEESKTKLEKIDTGLYLTELKFENSLDRITSAATPRQIERIPRGTEFNFYISYEQDSHDNAVIKEDINSIFNCLRLLNDAGLGGSLSRGYGRIVLRNLFACYRKLDYYRLSDVNEEKVYQNDQTLKEFEESVTSVISGR